VNPRLREAFPEHEVVTAVTTAWRQIRDHRLVDVIQGKFDVLVTIDRGFEFQHNLGQPQLWDRDYSCAKESDGILPSTVSGAFRRCDRSPARAGDSRR
jgi:hypothetical protein